MIYYMIAGHTLSHDVQTIIQVFYPNLHYYLTDKPSPNALTIESRWENHEVIASLYRNGVLCDTVSLPLSSDIQTLKEQKRMIKASIYTLLKKETGIRPQWGFVTGVRPAKSINELLDAGYSEEEARTYFIENYDVMPKKAELAIEVARWERSLLAKNNPDEISIYIGIPFCPTRCLYCSFTSYSLQQYKSKVDPYLDALEKELQYLSEYSKHYTIKNIYIGGGTPTSLSESQLERLLSKIHALFPISDSIEFTVEAGRPDTITEEKLRIMKEYGVNRISINPQTMNESTLRTIGRKHTPDEIREVFFMARKLGHDNINMDLILGLPGEGATEVEKTMKEIQSLAPDSITVHTLAVKRASMLKENFDQYLMTETQEMEEMLAVSDQYAKAMGMHPYYMYRQKNMVGNFENVGYCTPHKEGIYNVQIMEEKQTILAAGAGASTKIVNLEQNRIERIFNVKSVDDYITRIDEMIQRKKDGLPKHI
jgi:coproporphyrinogen dehydrogenase HemZ